MARAIRSQHVAIYSAITRNETPLKSAPVITPSFSIIAMCSRRDSHSYRLHERIKSIRTVAPRHCTPICIFWWYTRVSAGRITPISVVRERSHLSPRGESSERTDQSRTDIPNLLQLIGGSSIFVGIQKDSKRYARERELAMPGETRAGGKRRNITAREISRRMYARTPSSNGRVSDGHNSRGPHIEQSPYVELVQFL